MKFTANTSDLRDALKTVNMALQARSTAPIMECVLLTAEGGLLTLTGTDSVVQVSSAVPCSIEAEGRAAIRGKLLEDVIRRMPEGEVTLEDEGKHGFLVKCGRAKSHLAGVDPALFPVRAQFEASSKIRLPADELRAMIAGVESCISKDDSSRPVLAGGCIDVKDNVVSAVGLDGFRLGVKQVRLACETQNTSAIIPLKTLGILESMLASAGSEPVDLNLSADEFAMKVGSSSIKCTLISGEYINWRAILPKSFTTLAVVDAVQFRDAVERAALMARLGASKLVKLQVRDNAISIYATSGTDDMEETIDAEIEGDGLDIAFNVVYLQDALKAFSGGYVVLHFNSCVSPCVLCAEREVSGSYWMILPVRQ